MRICTCLGSCKGPEGLAPGWACALTVRDQRLTAVEQANQDYRRYYSGKPNAPGVWRNDGGEIIDVRNMLDDPGTWRLRGFRPNGVEVELSMVPGDWQRASESQPKCYLTEDDDPALHDLERFSAVCGQCYGALADLEREARLECSRLRSLIGTTDGSVVCTPGVLIDDIIAAHQALTDLGFADWPNERELTLSERIKEPRPCPLPGESRLCILCACDKPWGVFDSRTGAALCTDCRDKARAADGLREALDAAWTDIGEWCQLGQRQHDELLPVGHHPLAPTPAGIERSRKVQRLIGEALKAMAVKEAK